MSECGVRSRRRSRGSIDFAPASSCQRTERHRRGLVPPAGGQAPRAPPVAAKPPCSLSARGEVPAATVEAVGLAISVNRTAIYLWCYQTERTG
jgi:hypothetical protein